jgi:translocation and assembly module TamB
VLSKLLKVLGYLLLISITMGLTYLYIWEKPKLEVFVKKYVESQSKDPSVPFYINVGRAQVSILPLQLEFHDTELITKGDLKKTVLPIKIKLLAIKPSVLDIIFGKFWISEVIVDDAELKINLTEPPKQDEDGLELSFELNEILKKIPISELSLKGIKLEVNYLNDYLVKSTHTNIKAYNEKSSLILSAKDPELIFIDLKSKDKQELSINPDIQLMITKDTISLTKLSLIKQSSYLISSGHIIYKKSLDNFQELQIKSRINADFDKLHAWSNQIFPNQYLEDIQGRTRIDFQLSKKSPKSPIQINTNGDITQLAIGKILLGDLSLQANMPNREIINIESLQASLSGDSKAKISDAKIILGKKNTITADLDIEDLRLHHFLKQSGIADIPVWLRVSGSLKCEGAFASSFNMSCPGSISAKKLKVQNASRTKDIIKAETIDIAGALDISDKEISFKAKAKSGDSEANADGSINYSEGFKVNYQADVVNLTQLAPIADLSFQGVGTAKGQVSGDSRSAVFNIDLNLENMEFQKYYFGHVQTQLNYKLGTLYFENINGQIESTRYNGQLQVDLLKENIKGDLNLPFFRMEDIQQTIIKKVDLEGRFLGSGSGRIQLDTPFEIGLLNFIFEARLFKGNALGEDYSEAQIKLKSVDGIIIIQQAILQKEKAQISLKGTLNDELDTQISFEVQQGSLQNSTLLKKIKLPASGSFHTSGTIRGKLNKPEIKLTSEIEDLIFNKKKYGTTLFSFDNSNEQMNIQFNFPDKMDLLLVFPEKKSETIFVNLNMNKFDVAPIIGYFISDDPLNTYLIESTGEISGQFNQKDFWESEFSATIKDVVFHYRSSRISKTIPTNIELKNQTLFMNEMSFAGDRQFVKISQPETEKRRTKFIVNSRLNIALFKLFLPFFERIDGTSSTRLEVSLDDKDFKLVGSAVLTDSFFRLPGFPHPFENMTVDILFNQNRVSINSMKGELAGGRAIGSGEIEFNSDKKIGLLINTSLEGIDINFPDGFKTKGDASISLSGSKPPFLISGRYLIKDGLIDSNLASGKKKKSTDFLEDLLRKEAIDPLTLNLDISTENAIVVKTNIGNAVVEGYINGAFRVFDKVTSPRLQGEAQFDRNTFIRLRDNLFQVTSSRFQFDGESPINPRLSLRANTRLNSYDIDLNLQGRANKPVLKVASQPPLPENQIISMLALGTMPDQFAQTASPADAAAAATGTDTNPQAAPTGASGIGSGSGQASGFEFGTDLLGSNPIGRELDQYGVDVQFSSAFDDQNSAAVPKVTLRKRLGRKLQLSGSHSSGNISQTEGRVTYEIDNRLSTIFRVTDRSNDLNNINNINGVRQNNPFGIDLEYRLEFD